MTIQLDKKTPHSWQKKALKKFKRAKKAVFIVSRQSGKTEMGLQTLADFLFKFKGRRNPRALVAMTTHNQAFATYYTRLHDQLSDLPDSMYNRQGGGNSPIYVTLYRPWIGDRATVIFTGTGNADSLRGESIDLMILDEFAFFSPDLYGTVLEPMTRATKGKIFITSTLNGPNHFWKLYTSYKKLMDKGDEDYYALHLPIQKTGLFSQKEINKLRDEFSHAGLSHQFEQEYLCDPYAAGSDVAPFAKPISKAYKEHRVKVEVPVRNDYINISVDLGKEGNMPMWAWKQEGRHIKVVDYCEDAKTTLHLVDLVFQRYNKFAKINLFLPNDASQPSLELGGTRFDNMLQRAKDNGYSRRLRMSVLPKVKNNEELILQSIYGINKCIFHQRFCERGLAKMASARFIQNKTTGAVTFGKWQKGKEIDHAADAFKYIFAALYGQTKPGLIEEINRSNKIRNYNIASKDDLSYLDAKERRYY